MSRWGGEEFAILAQGADEADLRTVADRMRVLVARSLVRHGKRTIAVRIGAISNWVCVIRDVTERERAHREREQLAAIVEQSRNGITIATPDGHILYANPAFESEVGRRREELVGTAMPDAMMGLLEPATIGLIDDSVAAGQRWSEEVAIRRPDGTPRQIELSVTPERDGLPPHRRGDRDRGGGRHPARPRGRVRAGLLHRPSRAGGPLDGIAGSGAEPAGAPVTPEQPANAERGRRPALLGQPAGRAGGHHKTV